MVGVNHRLCMIARMVIYMLRVEPVLFSDASVLIEGAVAHIILFNVLVQIVLYGHIKRVEGV